MHIYVINGKPRAGKDQFVLFCEKHAIWCQNVSTVDFVKYIAYKCGWNGEKTPENRAFLSGLKKLLTDWNDVPYDKVFRKVNLFESEVESYDFSTDEAIVFIHCREPEEIDKFVNRMGAKTILIRRESVEGDDQSNASDDGVFDYTYDCIIENNGTLEELEQSAMTFLDGLGLLKS